MTDPTAPAADAPTWEEARGPHLPDRVPGVPLLAWPFVLLAVVQAVSIYRSQTADVVLDVGLVIQAILFAIPKVASCLLGAALFIRHRDAARATPRIAIGVTLFAAEQVLGMLYRPLQPVFEAIPASDEDGSFLMLSSSVYSLFSSIVGVSRGVSRI